MLWPTNVILLFSMIVLIEQWNVCHFNVFKFVFVGFFY
jgi:hypothetical protein